MGVVLWKKQFCWAYYQDKIT